MSMSKADILMDTIGLFPTGDRLDSLIEQLYDLHEELEQQLLEANALIGKLIDEADYRGCEASDLKNQLLEAQSDRDIYEELLIQRDGGSHDTACERMRSVRGCRCGHDDVLKVLPQHFTT